MSGISPRIAVEIVWVAPNRHIAVCMELPAGATIRDALLTGAPLLDVADIEGLAEQVGVFGERCDLQRLLKDGDRVEIYRPLLLDAKAARRLRAERTAQRTRQNPNRR